MHPSDRITKKNICWKGQESGARFRIKSGMTSSGKKNRSRTGTFRDDGRGGAVHQGSDPELVHIGMTGKGGREEVPNACAMG